ncbi:multiprotein bridging factor aMBF1 [Candidatus Woesearchaeota archaeon]|nr:multiprotein bridging factor aMBF1 [Candidatus Woesearchaeota archaeon]
MCGKEIEDYYRARIEGTILNVCENCVKFGKIIESVKSAPKEEIKEQQKAEKPPEPEIVEELVEDYAQRIKNKREKLGLKQEDLAKKINEKESIIQKIESGHFTPSIKLAKKLERFLEIKLIEEVEESGLVVAHKASSGEGFTLGDFVRKK